MVGGLVNHIISQAQIKGITNQRSEHAFEYRSLHRDHALLLQELDENQVSVGQGQHFPWLPLQDLFDEYLCESFMHLGPFLSGAFGVGAEEGVVSRKDRFGPMNQDRKSTRLNSSHLGISYAVF